jgi:hypothetical protein
VKSTTANRLLAALMVIGVLFGASACTVSSAPPQPQLETVANTQGVSAQNPLNSSQADADARTTQVRGGGPVRTWGDLDVRYRGDDNYRSCAEVTLGINWNNDVPRYKEIEKTRASGVLFIIAVNVGDKSHGAIRKFVREHEWPAMPNDVPIRKVDSITNTMDTTCKPFKDTRSLIRLSLAIPTNKVGDPATADGMAGIFWGCKNPWRADGYKPPTPVTSTSPSPSASESSSSPSSSPSPSASSSPSPKRPSDNPTVGDGTGPNDDPGPGESKSPDEMSSPPIPPRIDPTPPRVVPSDPPVVTSRPGGGESEAPPVNPSGDINHGVVPSRCADPAFC